MPDLRTDSLLNFTSDIKTRIINKGAEDPGLISPKQLGDLIDSIPSGSDTDYTTMQELFNTMLTVPKIDVDINEINWNEDYFNYYASYPQIVNTNYVFGNPLLAEIYYISSDFEIFATSTYSMNNGFYSDSQGSSTENLSVDYISFNGYIVVVYKKSKS